MESYHVQRSKTGNDKPSAFRLSGLRHRSLDAAFCSWLERRSTSQSDLPRPRLLPLKVTLAEALLE